MTEVGRVQTEQVKRGLTGVVADTTSISMVDADSNSLLYRGYPVEELAEQCSFEEVAYLLWYGELPTVAELDAFQQAERGQRRVSDSVMGHLADLPRNCHPMDVLRTAVSVLGAEDLGGEGLSVDVTRRRALSIMAKLPSVVAFDQRRRRGGHAIEPDRGLSFAENFFYQCFGSVPEGRVVRCLERSLVLYAEHSFNASTFTARVITSTLSDVYSAVTGAIGALKGPLHGGANEAVMAMLLEIGDPNDAEAWLAGALSQKRKIMGFGHRVYKHGDSRVPTMERTLKEMADISSASRMMELYVRLRDAMIREKGIYPNLDYPSALAYYLMGFDVSMFTPMFVMSRITGWAAHVMEQVLENALIRPLSLYIGSAQRSVPTGAR